MRIREGYIQQAMQELNSGGVTIVRIEDEPTTRGPLGNVYGRVNFVVQFDTDDPRYQQAYREMQEQQAAQAQNTNSGGGCYVATCVYGSYDCPEVWTLRRFRDDMLASTWLGRAFIRVYYAISPTLVKWFGDQGWFKKLWKSKLDKLVCSLREKGVDNAPYQDKVW